MSDDRWNDPGWKEAAREYHEQRERNGGRGHDAHEIRRRSQADAVLELALVAKLFLAPDGTGYADVIVHGHRETWPIKSRGFRRWLAERYFEREHKAVRSEPMQSVIGVLEAKASMLRSARCTCASPNITAASILTWRIRNGGP
jgi:hypothetical protein